MLRWCICLLPLFHSFFALSSVFFYLLSSILFYHESLSSLPSLTFTHPLTSIAPLPRPCPELKHTLRARSLVLRSSGIHRCKLLAKAFAEQAKEILKELPESLAKSGLVALTERVIGQRSWSALAAWNYSCALTFVDIIQQLIRTADDLSRLAFLSNTSWIWNDYLEST